MQLSIGPGKSVPIGQVAAFHTALDQPLVIRRNRVPTITVRADLAPGLEAEAVVGRLAPAIARFRASLPAGYGVAVGGSVEESAKAQASLGDELPIMLLLTLTVLMVQLQSFQRLMLVLSVVPLGLVGVVGIMLPTRTPLDFVGTLGCIALGGMIIRNAVILIDQIDIEIARGTPRAEAIVEATCNRVRPILLTAFAAVLGMIPIASDVFWRPLALAIMGGLVAATLLTLFYLPAAYCAWFGITIRQREPALAG